LAVAVQAAQQVHRPQQTVLAVAIQYSARLLLRVAAVRQVQQPHQRVVRVVAAKATKAAVLQVAQTVQQTKVLQAVTVRLRSQHMAVAVVVVHRQLVQTRLVTALQVAQV
jgi:hypothetical protein